MLRYFDFFIPNFSLLTFLNLLKDAAMALLLAAFSVGVWAWSGGDAPARHAIRLIIRTDLIVGSRVGMSILTTPRRERLRQPQAGTIIFPACTKSSVSTAAP